MVIQSGNLQMQSNHKLAKTSSYSYQYKESVVDTMANISGETLRNVTASGDPQSEDLFQTTLNYRLDSAKGNQATSHPEGANDAKEALQKTAEKSPMERLMMGKSHHERMQTLGYLLLQILYGRAGGDYQYDLEAAAQDYLTQHTYTLAEYTYTSSYLEEESYTFETTGVVQTADGRQIDFGLTVGMSRTFYQENTTFVQRLKTNLLDPLVINTDADVTSISDQKFYFDLDGDGDEEYISKLSAGCGFLALDKNGDGTINNGRELFGPNQGNGFEELALYDADGNGWIDEADEIFDQLKIWEFDEDGEATLYSLKDKNVGAICLQRTNTAFQLNDAKTNTTNGLIRETGVFLTENGMAGTIQHMDFAI